MCMNRSILHQVYFFFKIYVVYTPRGQTPLLVRDASIFARQNRRRRCVPPKGRKRAGGNAFGGGRKRGAAEAHAQAPRGAGPLQVRAGCGVAVSKREGGEAAGRVGVRALRCGGMDAVFVLCVFCVFAVCAPCRCVLGGGSGGGGVLDLVPVIVLVPSLRLALVVVVVVVLFLFLLRAECVYIFCGLFYDLTAVVCGHDFCALYSVRFYFYVSVCCFFAVNAVCW